MGILDDAIREHLDLKRRRGADPTEVERLEREALGPVRRGPHDALADEDVTEAGSYRAEENASGWSDSLEEPAPFDHSTDQATEYWPEGEFDDEFDERAEPPSVPRRPSGNDAEPLGYDTDPLAGYEPEPAPPRSSDLPRHHEIAEEWESHERQGLASESAELEPDAPAPTPPVPDPASSTPPPAPAGPAFDEERQRQGSSAFEEETAEYQVEAEEGFEEEPGEPAEGEDVLEETPDFLQDTPDHDRLWFEQRPPRDFDFDG